MSVGKHKTAKQKKLKRKVSSPAAGAAKPRRKLSSGSGKIVRGGIKAAIDKAKNKHKKKKS